MRSTGQGGGGTGPLVRQSPSASRVRRANRGAAEHGTFRAALGAGSEDGRGSLRSGTWEYEASSSHQGGTCESVSSAAGKRPGSGRLGGGGGGRVEGLGGRVGGGQRPRWERIRSNGQVDGDIRTFLKEEHGAIVAGGLWHWSEAVLPEGATVFVAGQVERDASGEFKLIAPPGGYILVADTPEQAIGATGGSGSCLLAIGATGTEKREAQLEFFKKFGTAIS